MGWLSLLAPQGSPFASFLANNQNAIHGVGAGLASGTDFSNGLGLAAQYAAQGAQKDSDFAIASKKEQERLDNIQKAQEWLRANFPKYAGLPSDLGIDLAKTTLEQQLKGANGSADPADVATYKFYAQQETAAGRTPMPFGDWRKGGNQTPKGALNTPLPFRDAQGNYHAIQQFTDGSTVDLSTGQPMDKSLVYDPFGYAGNKTAATVDAKTAGAARAALPGAQQARDIAQKATNALLNDTQGMAEQFGNTLGIPNQKMPFAWPGSPMARFRTELEQGGGQAFLQARQMLKGGGQITDFEGAKAEAAFSRMQLAAQNNNQEEFMQAVRDFQDAVNSGYEKLQAAANGQYAAGSPAVTGGQGGASIDDLVKKYGG
jgi:hypothetical protein